MIFTTGFALFLIGIIGAGMTDTRILPWQELNNTACAFAIVYVLGITMMAISICILAWRSMP